MQSNEIYGTGKAHQLSPPCQYRISNLMKQRVRAR